MTVATADLCPPGPFDLAYVRRFLVHQPDPAGCLRRIAGLVRPGGRIVAHEIPPGTGYPALTPTVPALHRVDELVHAGVRARGGRHDAAHHFAALCRASSTLRERGFVPAAEPLALLETFQAVPRRSLRSVIVSQGVTTERELDDLLGELEDAKTARYISAFANLYIEMIAEVPDRLGGREGLRPRRPPTCSGTWRCERTPALGAHAPLATIAPLWCSATNRRWRCARSGAARNSADTTSWPSRSAIPPSLGGALSSESQGVGTEIEGLGAILQQQGAKSVLATLWKVRDAGTARFMEAFYAARGQDRRMNGGAFRKDRGGDRHVELWSPSRLTRRPSRPAPPRPARLPAPALPPRSTGAAD